VLPLLLIGTSLGKWRVHLRASWHWRYQAWGKLLAASHSSHIYSPPATKTLPCERKTLSHCATHGDGRLKCQEWRWEERRGGEKVYLIMFVFLTILLRY